jgi:hypothetical protein
VPAFTRPLGSTATATVIAAIGFAVGLAGDACHVASGTTVYEWDGVPTIWRSAIWFPLLVAGSVVLAAWLAERQSAKLPPVNERARGDVIAGAAAVLALYALTAVLKGEPETVSVILTASIAVLIWRWWDPSAGALVVGLAAAVAGPLVEIGVVAAGAASYAGDSDGLAGVAPWLPCLYFAAGAVASRLWRAVAGAPIARPAPVTLLWGLFTKRPCRAISSVTNRTRRLPVTTSGWAAYWTEIVVPSAATRSVWPK